MQRPWGKSIMCWITGGQTEKGHFKGPQQVLARTQAFTGSCWGQLCGFEQRGGVTSISAGPLQVKLISFKIPSVHPGCMRCSDPGEQVGLYRPNCAFPY